MPARIPGWDLKTPRMESVGEKSQKEFVMKFVIMMMLLVPAVANAMLSSMRACPQKFIASVEKISEESGSDHARSVSTVTLLNEETILGDVGEREEIKVLKFGSIQLEMGERYVVELDKHKICQITKVGELAE